MEERLTEMVKKWKETEYAELEAYMTHVDTISGGITPQLFKHIYSRFEDSTSKGIFKASRRKRFIDFFYEDSKRLRTEIGFPPIYVTKNKLSSLQSLCPERKSIGLVFNLKTETPVTNNNKDDFPEPIFVRMQQVWEFTYKDTFLYSFKRVLSGKNKEEACKNTPTYEIELEILRNKDYMNHNDNQYIASDFIEKTLDLVGRQDSITGEIVPVSLNLISTMSKNGMEPVKQKRKYITKPKQDKKIKTSV